MGQMEVELTDSYLQRCIEINNWGHFTAWKGIVRYSFYRKMRGPLTNMKAVSKKEILALVKKRNLVFQVASSHFNYTRITRLILMLPPHIAERTRRRFDDE
jgi:hypothetical protein